MNTNPKDSRRFSVYVIGLNRDVLTEQRFLADNPQHDPIKPCVYIGMTGLSPEARFLNHKNGIKACKYVTKYGECLKRRLYRRFNPMTYENAQAMERELARRLRNRGYAVWQK